MAHDAARLAGMEHCLRLFQEIPDQRRMETHPRPTAKPSTAKRWTPSESQRGDHRQSIRKDHGKRGPRGYDAGKKINGRKRHLVVDTIGLILAVVVHEANIQDRDGAKLVLERLKGCFPRLALIWADGGYAGKLVEWVKQFASWTLEIVKRNDDLKGFYVLPRRWVVERTFGWLGRYRRLSKDYEQRTDNSEAMILLAMINLMSRRLGRAK